jgi:hypothetical protein
VILALTLVPLFDLMILSAGQRWIFKNRDRTGSFQRYLKKKYANDHDAGYTYIDSAIGDSVPLTLFMMKEWAQAMVGYCIRSITTVS